MPPRSSQKKHQNYVNIPTVPALFLANEIASEENQFSRRSLDSGSVEAESHRGPSHQQRPQIQHSESSFYDHAEKDGTDNEHHQKLSDPTKKRDILFAAALIFIPILTISLLLLGFTFSRSVRLTFQDDSDVNNPDKGPLPSVKNPSHGYYYTDIDSTRYVLVGSWASNIALGLFAPFMLLFSFLVAWTATSENNIEVSHILHELLKGSQGDGLWRWLQHLSRNVFFYGRVRKAESRSLYVAGVGFLSAFLMR